MGLVSSMDALRSTLATAGLTGIDEDNCVVQDEGVFNNVLLRDDPDYRRAIIVGYEGMRRKGSSEFGGTLLCWHLSITAFVLLWGDIDQIAESIRNCHELIDEIFVTINNTSMLDGSVMDCAIIGGEVPMLYERQQMNDYMMVTLIVEVTENIYGD